MAPLHEAVDLVEVDDVIEVDDLETGGTKQLKSSHTLSFQDWHYGTSIAVSVVIRHNNKEDYLNA